MPRDPRNHRPAGRRADHAHRIPAGDGGPRGAQALGPGARRDTDSRGRGRGIVLSLAVVLVAVLALVVRPFDGAGVSSGGGSLGAASTPAASAQRLAFAGSTGPHGDEAAADRQTPRPSADPNDAASAEPAASAAAPLLAGYQWPLADARITNGYGLGRPGSFVVGSETFHDGIDLASFCGARVTAAHAGTVLASGRHHEAYIGWVGDLAPMRAKLDAEDKWGSQAIAVVIDDGNGYRSIYAHLGLATVHHGDVVAAGDVIGYEGASGNATGCHLHYALFDPLETATLTLDPKVVEKSRLPPLEIARIDPLDVFPPLADAGITWGWGAH